MNVDIEPIILMTSAIKEFCFGFEEMNRISDQVEPGSTVIKFYLNGLYQYIATFYLLSKGKDPMGGTFYKTLKPMGLEYRLDDVRAVLEKPLDETSFGKVVSEFRSKFVVHGNYRNSDLDGIYEKVNMEDPEIQEQFQELMMEIYLETRKLAVLLCEDAGIDPEDCGIHFIE